MAKRVRIGSTDSEKKPNAEVTAAPKEEESKSSPSPKEPESRIRVRKKSSDQGTGKSEPEATPEATKPKTRKRISTAKAPAPEEKPAAAPSPAPSKPKKQKRVSSRRDKPLEIEKPEEEIESEREESHEEETPGAPKKRSRGTSTRNKKQTGDKGTRGKKESKAPKKSGPNILLIVGVAALVILVFWFQKKQPVKNPAKSNRSTLVATGGASVSAEATFKSALKNRGRAIGIGPEALKFEVDGLTVGSPDKIPGLQSLLEGTDVNAVINALEKAGVRHVLVDPSITRRNPIPKATVKNRLALGRPAGALSAKLMSKKLFHYELGKPPLKLSPEAKKALTAITRATFGGGSGNVPTDAPKILNRKGNWGMVLTVRPLQATHISYHSRTANTLAEAAAKIGAKAKLFYEKRSSLQNKYGPLKEALANKLTIELEVLYDEGTYVGPRDEIFLWRVIEPGIYGIRLNVEGKAHFQPPWYSVTNNYRPIVSILEKVSKQAAKNKDYWKDASVPIDRFRTVHWRERQPGGEIEDLYRASNRVPSMKDVTRENLIASLKGLGDWIADNQTHANGRYVYRYFPTKDNDNNEYNFVRHCLGPFSMTLTEEFAPHPKYREKAEAGMKFIEDRIRWGGPPKNVDGNIDDSSDTWMGKPLPGDDVAIVEFQEPQNGQWSSKMGAVAVTILGYTQFARVGWDLGAEHQKVLDGLANFLLYMQNEEEGNFHHYYVGTRNPYYGTRNSIYPGEILYAIARLYGVTKENRFKVAFKKAFEANLKWFKGQMDQRLADGTYEEEHRKNLVQFQPWMAMALDEMYRYDPDPAYVEASNLVSLWILDAYQYDETRAFFPDKLGGYMKVLDELPAMHTFVYTEGTAASFDLARRAGSDPAIVDKLRKGAFMSARFIMQMQARPGENDYYYLNPDKAKGAVRYCMNHNKQRIDYTYHALSSIYRILKAATDEDYAAVQTIPMPQEW